MDREKSQIMIAGVGGQGVLFTTKVILETSRRLNRPVIGSETHGMSQRGGSVVSTVKIGSFRNPAVGQGGADFLLALNAVESIRHIAALSRGGTLVANAPDLDFLPQDLKSALEGREARALAVDGTQASLDLGSPLVANLVCLGFSAQTGALPFTVQDWIDCIEAISPERFLKMNQKAFAKGIELAEGA